MKNEMAALVILTLSVGACGGSGSDDAASAGMSAEEHAHVHGGMGGATDSTGNAIRQTITLSPDQERVLGVTFITVRRMPLARSIRTVGQVTVEEPRVVDVTPKIDGFVEELYAETTGESVQQGEPLLTLYSPALVAAQEELLTARRMTDRLEGTTGEAWRNAQGMLDAARRRLEYWDVTADDVRRIEQTGEVSKALPLVAPASGVLLEKNVIEGQRVSIGERLYRIADLTEVWVEGDVFEQDLQFVQVGTQAHIEVSAYPGHHLMGRVSFVYPVMDRISRTNRVRVAIGNADKRLKPGMFATVFFTATIGNDVLVVPAEAVVRTGERNIVFVRHADRSLMPHDVVLGARAGELVQILSGVQEGQAIVAAANFLVDAESQLGSAGRTMPGMQHGDQVTGTTPNSSSADHEGHSHD